MRPGCDRRPVRRRPGAPARRAPDVLLADRLRARRRLRAEGGRGRFNSGAIPRPSLAGLEAALAGAPDWRFERARQTAEYCRERLAERHEVVTEPGQATLVTFRPGGDAAEIAARLYDRGVVVRDMPHTPWLRVSVGYWTSEGDIGRLLDGLAA